MHWEAGGHRKSFQLLVESREQSIKLSGSSTMWSELLKWLKFHQSTLANATHGCLLRMKHEQPDVISTHVLKVRLRYAPLGPEKDKRPFELLNVIFASRETALLHSPDVLDAMETEMYWTRQNFWDVRWGTGAYVIAVQFGLAEDEAKDVLVWRNFNIDNYHGEAKHACRALLPQLEQFIREERRVGLD